MINFKQFLLLEATRLEFLAAQHKDIDTSHDPEATRTDSMDIVNHFAEHADPTHNKAYTGWIMNQYKNKGIVQSDAPLIKASLSNFDRYKSRLDEKDISKYPDLNSVDLAVEPHLGTASTNAEAEEAGRTKLFDNGDKQIYHLHDKEAAQRLYGGGSGIGGDHTDWCTSWRREGCQFDQYNKGGAKLYTIHVKGDENSPYQYHTGSGEFKDRDNTNVDHEEFAEKHEDLAPALEKISPDFDMYGEGAHFEDHIKSPLPYIRGRSLRTMAAHPDDLIHVLKHDPHPEVKKAAIDSPAMHMALDNAADDLPDSHPGIDESRQHAKALIDAAVFNKHDEVSAFAGSELSDFGMLQSHHITHLLNLPDTVDAVRMKKLLFSRRIDNITPEHLDMGMHNSSSAAEVLKHPLATNKHVVIGLRHHDPGVRKAATDKAVEILSK